MEDNRASADVTQWEEVDLREYLQLIFKWKWVIVLLTLAAVATSAVFSYFIAEPVYATKAVLMVTQPDGQRVARQDGGLESVVNTVSRMPEMTINTYVGQIKNATVFQNVVENLGLDKLGYTARSLDGMVSVNAVKDTNLIEIKVASTNPRMAADVANATSRQFLDFISMSNEQQMSRSVVFLQNQFGIEEDNLTQARQKVEEFESQPRSVDFLTQELMTRTADLNKYRSREIEVDLELQQLTAGRARLMELLQQTPPVLQAGVGSEPSGNLTGEAGQESGDRVLVIQEGVEKINPVYTNLQSQLDARVLNIIERGAMLAGIQGTMVRLEQNIRDLQAEVAEKRMVENQLRREVDRLEKTRDLLAEKITETQIAKSINLGETNLINVSSAVIPVSPIKPNKQLNMAIAAVLGLMVAVGLAFLLEFLDNTVKTPEDVQRHLGLATLGSIPEYKEMSGGRKGPGKEKKHGHSRAVAVDHSS